MPRNPEHDRIVGARSRDDGQVKRRPEFDREDLSLFLYGSDRKSRHQRFHNRPKLKLGSTVMMTVMVHAPKWQLTLGYAAAALWLGYHIMHLVLAL